MLYATEAFTADEVEVLERHFTNVDRPVFALVNLPEVVKGALFARYSRSPKSLRRLFLDEFADAVAAGGGGPAETGVGRAEDVQGSPVPRLRLVEAAGVLAGHAQHVADLGHVACPRSDGTLGQLQGRQQQRLRLRVPALQAPQVLQVLKFIAAPLHQRLH